MGNYGYGYLPDTHDKTKDLNVRHLLGARRGVPAGFSLEQYVSLTGVKDQGQTGSCVGQAFAMAVFIRCAVLGTPIPFPSPVNIYTVARGIDRPDFTSALQDNGSMPNQAVRGMAEWGVTSNDKWPFDPATINDEPTWEELEDASVFELDGAYRIDTAAAERLADIQQALSSGFPVAIGLGVDQAFEDYMGGQNADGSTATVTAPDPNGILGGHMLCLLGYKPDGRRTIYRGIDSWGVAWGDGGLFWADEGFLTTALLTDCFAINAMATHLGAAA
jgi:hypothetical protein